MQSYELGKANVFPEPLIDGVAASNECLIVKYTGNRAERLNSIFSRPSRHETDTSANENERGPSVRAYGHDAHQMTKRLVL